MPRVDFYILGESHPPSRFACTLTARALQDRLRVHIHARSREDAANLDSLLWTFRDISFVPHALADDPAAGSAPVVLGWQGMIPGPGALLINLTDELPGFAPHFERVLELVGNDDRQKQLARQRFRQYREQGWEIHSHEI